MHTPLIARLRTTPVASLNTALAGLGQPWRVEPVVEWEGAFVLSTSGPVQPDRLADIADDLGLDDLSDLDDYLCPREPWDGLAGFVVKDDAPEAAGEVAVWAAGKLGLAGLISPHAPAKCR